MISYNINLMRYLLMLVMASVLLATALLPAIVNAGCNKGVAELHGGYQIDMGFGPYIYKQEMKLKRDGPGLHGRWIGTEHRQTLFFPQALNPGPGAVPNSTIPGVKATCTTSTPAPNMIDTVCRGRYPFVVHKDWTITWEGKPTVIGYYKPSEGKGLGRFHIDMLAGAPNEGQAVAGAFGMDLSMTGPVQTEIDGQLDISVDSAGLKTVMGGQAGKKIRFLASLVPASAQRFAEVDLISYRPTLKRAPLQTRLGSDHLELTFYGSKSQRREQASNLKLTATAALGDCKLTLSTTALELLLAAGVEP
jgi:hypothetical protein